MMTRRRFFRDGAGVVALSLVAPAWLAREASAQAGSRVLVVLDLAGGNDSLSMLVPYTDPHYYSRRPTLAVPAGRVLPVGSDSAGNALGLHPRLAGLAELYDRGRLALIQRVGYENSSRSHFLGTDIWSTANPLRSVGPGWLGRVVDLTPPPVDPLTAWATVGETPHMLLAERARTAAIRTPSSYTFGAANTGAEAQLERAAVARLAADAPPDRRHLAFVAATAQAALSTVDRVAQVNAYVPSAVYPGSPLAQAFRTVAGAIAREIGTRIFWVQTGGYDTHALQGTNASNGTYWTLMATLSDALAAFAADLEAQGLFDRVLVLQFSEFGRRISENGSQGTDHGAASAIMVAGGRARGGIYGTAPSLTPSPSNPTLENNGADVRHETDFRSVYARILDAWLGVDSTGILGGNFRKPGLDFV